MPNFKCINKDCSELNKEVYVSKISFKFNEETKRFDTPFGKDAYCNKCKHVLQYIEKENKTIPTFFLTDFKQMTPEAKKAALKKRANKHNEKNMKDKVHAIKKRFGI